jgi:3-hydroxyacyl-CoA dehydrogenase
MLSSRSSSLSSSPIHIRKVAVLGAGVMGAQIAAHLVNCKVQAVLYELPAKEGDPNGLVRKALEGLAKIEPSPIASPDVPQKIYAANYDQHLPALAECDLIIEAIAERMDWKKSLYEKIAPHVAEHAIIASNTSGLSITQLAGALPEKLRPRFCGVHFFNPPRYMHLVELISHVGTRPEVIDQLESFLSSGLGKGVIRAKDTPNFIANRVGVFSMLATMHHCVEFGLGFDTVDALTGPAIGRPKSATFRTADVVGLDTLAHVINTMRDTLPNDPWHAIYKAPQWLQTLIEKGALGQKTKLGIYRKPGKEIEVLDLNLGEYRVAAGEPDAEMAEILKIKDPAEKLSRLRSGKGKQAQFMWACLRDVFHYSAVHLESIAENARDLDLAIRWGFGWNQGPFETWQAAGWQQVAKWINEDLASGKTLAKAPLPKWAEEGHRNGVHSAQGSFSPASNGYAPRSKLPVYKRQPYPDALLGESATHGTTVFETDAVRCWHGGDDIAVLSFKTKLHSIGADVLDGTLQAIAEAERGFAGLVIWQTEPPFSVGANLSGGGSKKPEQAAKPSAFGSMFKKFKREAQSVALKAAFKLNVADKVMAAKLEEVERVVAQFQQTTMALRYCAVPTVAAVDGFAFGGGCEYAMHCDRAVATLESYMGLVEVGVGLLPAGGGCKELSLRAAQEAKGGDIFQFLKNYFQNAAMGQVSRSAEQAREFNYLRVSDPIIANRFELLHVARANARALAETGYRPPLPPRFPVAGKSGIATLKAGMVNMMEGGFISPHDFLIGSKIAHVMCGGEVEAGSMVDEDWILDLERQAFLELAATEKTQERIQYMLKNGKPLRN